MTRAYLALGANIGEPRAQLAEALKRIDTDPAIDIVARSAVIETEPWGKPDQPRFLNQVIAVETALAPRALLETCLGIERQMGRVRTEKWGPRVIDIDIVAYGRRTIDETGLTLPHPQAHKRDFVIDPLREIDPQTADWIAAQGAKP